MDSVDIVPDHWEQRTRKLGPRTRTFFVPNHKSFGMFIRSSEMRDTTEAVANDIMKVAVTLTPRSKKDEKGHVHMQDSYRVKRNAGLIKVDRAFRVRVLVINTAPHAPAVEFGSGTNTPHRPLANAGAAFGDFK